VSVIDMNGYGAHESNGRHSKTNASSNPHSRLDVPIFAHKNRVSDEVQSIDAGSVCTASYSDMNKFDPKRSVWSSHPQVKSHWQVFLAALCLLIVGTVLLVLGIVVVILPDLGFQSYVFFIAGIMCFIPGAYHVVFVYCAIKGRKGYDLYKLPLFN